MNVVLISEAGGGKDFLAGHAIRSYGYTRYALATHVNITAKKYFPERYGNGEKKDRPLLQEVGTKFREIDEDVWIKAMFKDIDNEAAIRKKCMELQEFIVITDCRLPNEYQALKDRGFIFIRINVNEETRKQRMIDRGDKFTEIDMKHHTESFYDQFECEYEMENNGTQEEAYQSLSRILDSIGAADTKLEVRG